MVAVDTMDAVKYGFRLLGYLLAVFIAGGILIAIGLSFQPTGFRGGGNPLMALLFFVAGIAVIYAGGLGMLYKVIGDGVEIGNRAAEQPAQRTTPQQGTPAQGGHQQNPGGQR